MEYTVALAPLNAKIDDTVAMWRDHWNEQGEEAARAVEFNPDVPGFLDAEQRGWFAYIVVRLGEEIVGHFGLAFRKNRQTSQFTAGDEFLYLKPEHRKGMLALKLIRFAKALAFEKGAVEFGVSYRTFGSVDIDPLLRRCGMSHIANVYSVRR